jgi:NADH-quinone oxidoreductase subunit N
VVSHVGGVDERLSSIADYRGLAYRSPLLGGVLAFFLVALIGIPFTGGFFGKFYVFSAALQAGNVWLAVVGLLNSGVACFYYLRLLGSVYARSEPPQSNPKLTPETVPASGTVSIAAGLGLTLAAVATLLLGVLPNRVLHLATDASSSLRATTPSQTAQSTR